MATEAGYDREAWQKLNQELGLTAIHIPEAYGGGGFGQADLAIVVNPNNPDGRFVPVADLRLLGERMARRGGAQGNAQGRGRPACRCGEADL